MTDRNHEEIRTILKKAFPPVDTEPRRDLWPGVLRRLNQQAAPVPWYDWAMAGLLAGMFFVFPRLILVLVYHL